MIKVEANTTYTARFDRATRDALARALTEWRASVEAEVNKLAQDNYDPTDPKNPVVQFNAVGRFVDGITKVDDYGTFATS